jgi:hypothetical protein
MEFNALLVDQQAIRQHSQGQLQSRTTLLILEKQTNSRYALNFKLTMGAKVELKLIVKRLCLINPIRVINFVKN